MGGMSNRLWLWTAVVMVAFAANSVLCRMALGAGAIDPTSSTLIRLASGAAVLVPLAGVVGEGDARPGLGPPLTLTRVPRKVAAGGLNEFDGRRVYVSRGVGVERGQAPRIRLFCRPEVSVITVR